VYQPIEHQIPKYLLLLHELLNQFSIQDGHYIFPVTLFQLSASDVHIKWYPHVHHKTLEGAVSLATHEVALRVVGLLEGGGTDQICF